MSRVRYVVVNTIEASPQHFSTMPFGHASFYVGKASRRKEPLWSPDHRDRDAIYCRSATEACRRNFARHGGTTLQRLIRTVVVEIG
jgi:hypothetical protein